MLGESKRVDANRLIGRGDRTAFGCLKLVIYVSKKLEIPKKREIGVFTPLFKMGIILDLASWILYPVLNRGWVGVVGSS